MRTETAPRAAGRSTPLRSPETWARGAGVRTTSPADQAVGPRHRHRLPGQAPLGVQDRLGPAGRARGEDDRGQVGRAGGRAVRADRRAVGQRAEARPCRRGPRPPRRSAAAGEPSPPSTRRGRAAATDASTSAVPATRLSGTATAPSRQQARSRQTAAAPLGSWKATAVAAPDPGPPQPPGQPVDRRRQLGPTHPPVAVDHPVGPRRHRRAQQASSEPRSHGPCGRRYSARLVCWRVARSRRPPGPGGRAEAQCGSQASGSVVRRTTASGSFPVTTSSRFTCSSTSRSDARTATHTCWRCSAAPP